MLHLCLLHLLFPQFASFFQIKLYFLSSLTKKPPSPAAGPHHFHSVPLPTLFKKPLYSLQSQILPFFFYWNTIKNSFFLVCVFLLSKKISVQRYQSLSGKNATFLVPAVELELHPPHNLKIYYWAMFQLWHMLFPSWLLSLYWP